VPTAGRFAADIAEFVAKAKGAEKAYLEAVSGRLLTRIIENSAIDTSWLRNHWRASVDGSMLPNEPRPPRDQVPMRPAGDASLAACAPVFAAWEPGQKLLIYNNATSEDGTDYYPLHTEFGGPRNPAHYTLTRTVAQLPEIAAEALGAARAAAARTQKP
jgi:hypothetical protein